VFFETLQRWDLSSCRRKTLKTRKNVSGDIFGIYSSTLNGGSYVGIAELQHLLLSS